ncbi:hypothetical protein BCR41DRAFT_357405 [Lobosporangium transversale]|uniref:Uncharacterized protein n=1 Tax=Lobosporangium transversale TaxID=64571 RepID=A0A1Y2GHN7_9FUNG|nr:hypothetical protein BCR41DRAFT_357405 [Lobosporangium transversale]ORZ11045.1 hypothetical protein BCR41DRAFT_357405 [Lobosporangium transversale]|eukprot:XP_021879562.1 hypothetical protein BCR41DRAFT_357405 [Lobosporangium transversale]
MNDGIPPQIPLLMNPSDSAATGSQTVISILHGDIYVFDIYFFFDARSNTSTILKKYDESHSDDITNVKFHPTNPARVMTGLLETFEGSVNPALGLTLDYGIDCQYEPDSGRLYLISGSNEADSLQLCQVLQGGHSEIVRSTCWDPKRGILFSGGEDAKLGLWTSTASTTTPSPLVASASSNKAHHCSLSRSARSNPY